MLIDEKVFGYAWAAVGPDDCAGPTVTHRLYRNGAEGGHIRAERHADGRVRSLGGNEYSTKIAAAWLVVERLNERFHARVDSPFEPGADYFAGFTPHGVSGWNGSPDYQAGAPTAPLAICRAALAAVGAA